MLRTLIYVAVAYLFTDPVTSGQIKDSSIRPLVEGRKNIELVNKKLNEDQVRIVRCRPVRLSTTVIIR